MNKFLYAVVWVLSVALFGTILSCLIGCHAEADALDMPRQVVTLPDGFTCKAKTYKFFPAVYGARCDDGTWILNLTNARVVNAD